MAMPGTIIYMYYVLVTVFCMQLLCYRTVFAGPYPTTTTYYDFARGREESKKRNTNTHACQVLNRHLSTNGPVWRLYGRCRSAILISHVLDLQRRSRCSFARQSPGTEATAEEGGQLRRVKSYDGNMTWAMMCICVC